ncbi:MAG: RNA methyltransferase, partial [Coriobacteriales bacterium]|nr:RNA methyltransferase [Coriobacteriales bacterium]
GEADLFKELTGYKLNRGVLCAMHRPPAKSVEEVVAGAKNLVILEDINNHTNIGSIFRNAAGLGADGIVLSPTCCDPLFRRACRVSMGAVFKIPWAISDEMPCDWPNYQFELLHKYGFKTLSLTLSDTSIDLNDFRRKNDEKLALFFGAEGSGLKKKTIDMCDVDLSIKMQRGVDSLNVANASAVVFWELFGKR